MATPVGPRPTLVLHNEGVVEICSNNVRRAPRGLESRLVESTQYIMQTTSVVVPILFPRWDTAAPVLVKNACNCLYNFIMLTRIVEAHTGCYGDAYAHTM